MVSGKPRCGYIALVGRPNVGKSTLLNALVGKKISITSRKPQTTRHQILGIRTTGLAQSIFVDTPGIHCGEAHALNAFMNRVARQALREADIAILVTDALRWTAEEEAIARLLPKRSGSLRLLLINKVDKIQPRSRLLNHMAAIHEKFSFDAILPLSALKARDVLALAAYLEANLPENPHLYDADALTDRSERFLGAELIREKIIHLLGDEIPYAATVLIDTFTEKPDGEYVIHATIILERPSQKKILIGKKGERIKQIGENARRSMAQVFGRKVHLMLWVKIKEGWSDNAVFLQQLGYT